MGHLQNVPRQNIPRQKIWRQIVPSAKCSKYQMSQVKKRPKPQNIPNTIRPKPQKVPAMKHPKYKTSQASKCPKPQNIPNIICPRHMNECMPNALD